MTGVLPIALNSASRVNQFLLSAGKEYVCLLRLHKPTTEDKVKKVLDSFIGTIRQVPPKRSAVKRVERSRTVYYLDIMEIKLPYILFRIGCQAGTYIRKICWSIGEKVGGGAHMHQLIRTKAGPFDLKDTVSLVELQDAFVYYKEGNDKPLKKIILPPEQALTHLRSVWANDQACGNIAFGADLFTAGIVRLDSEIKKDETVVVYSLKDELVAVGKASHDSKSIQGQKKGVAVKTHKIFLKPGVYPR